MPRQGQTLAAKIVRPRLPRPRFCLFVRPTSLPPPLQRAPRPAWKQHAPVSGDASSCAVGPVKPLFWFAHSFLSRVTEGDGPENNTHGAKRVGEEGKPREGLVTDAGHCSAPESPTAGLPGQHLTKKKG